MRNRKSLDIKLATQDECTGCAACASICPSSAISMREDKEGFLQPNIDARKCVGCHKCEKICPIINPIEVSADYETQAYAAFHKDEDIRMRSSSGGAFYALAKDVINQGGVVFGARFDDNWEVKHDYTETIDRIEPFMRSKYVQSRIGDTYKQAKQFLKEGRQVLFVGTPCQIGGLNKYLGIDYDNLLMVDIICHGVPSPAVWRDYLKGNAKGDKVLNVNFRDKNDGWLDFQFVTTTNTATIRENHMDNIYFRGFVFDIYLRKSCYNCPFRNKHRFSDITLADFWGVQHIYPNMENTKGVSAVLIHTIKGLKQLRETENLSFFAISTEEVVTYNSSAITNVVKPSRRDSFFRLFRIGGFGIARYYIDHIQIRIRIKREIKKILRHIISIRTIVKK